PSPYGGSLRRSEWSRSSKPSRLSFNAGCMIAWPKSVHGSGRSCWAITNTTLFPGTPLSCASSNFACAGYGRVFWSAAVSAHRCVGNVSPSLEPVDSSTPRSAPLSRRTLLRHSSFVRAVCVNALVRICAGCALKAHGIQSPEMEAAAKLSEQPRTKSCVVPGNGHCEA
ncbi:MAG: hypothetical protein JWO91_877, partial [Acidobacteriaceae bacterium]|nr:hypothetical protein [Acidobacteriaceae bacterium]